MAGLPLLVLFSVPVATNVKNATVGLTLAFCLGITGYLALLAADGRQRLRLWGRLVTVWQETPDDEDARGPDTRAARRVGPPDRPGRRGAGHDRAAGPARPARARPASAHNPAPGAPAAASSGPAAPLVQMRSQLTRAVPSRS